MRFLVISTLLSIAGAISHVQPSSVFNSAAFDQGDGFYLATFNESGMADIHFTPMSNLSVRARSSRHLERSPSESPGDKFLALSTECSNRHTWELYGLDTANIMLAENANNHGAYKRGDWGWVSRMFQV